MRSAARRILGADVVGIAALLVAMGVMAAVLPPIGASTGAEPVSLPLVAGTETTVPESAAVRTPAPTAEPAPTVADAPSATEPAITAAPDTTDPAVTAPSTPSGGTQPATTIASPTTAADTAPVNTTPATTAPDQESLGPVSSENEAATVVSIQTVPAVRNLIILIGGRPRATDSNGTIDLGPDEVDADIEVVGLAAEPPIERVALLQWSDGNRELERSLQGVPGPVLQLGLEVRNRVFVQLGESAPEVESVRFTSSTGAVLTLDVDEPVWVPRARAILVNGELIAEELDYELIVGDQPLQPASFSPRPEAAWVIEGR